MDGSNGVTIKNLNKVTRALTKAGVDAQDQKALMHEIGMIVVRAAQPPVRSGALAGSMRAGRGKTKAVVRAGGARVPYAGVIHYGWPKHNIEANPFLLKALESQRDEVYKKLDEGMGDVLRKNDLI